VVRGQRAQGRNAVSITAAAATDVAPAASHICGGTLRRDLRRSLRGAGLDTEAWSPRFEPQLDAREISRPAQAADSMDAWDLVSGRGRQLLAGEPPTGRMWSRRPDGEGDRLVPSRPGDRRCRHSQRSSAHWVGGTWRITTPIAEARGAGGHHGRQRGPAHYADGCVNCSKRSFRRSGAIRAGAAAHIQNFRWRRAITACLTMALCGRWEDATVARAVPGGLSPRDSVLGDLLRT